MKVILLVLVLTDSDISDFIHHLESQDIQVELMKHRDYMSAAPHSAAINVTGSSKVSERLTEQSSHIQQQLTVLCRSAGLQIQPGLQQHHRPLFTHDREYSE